MKQKNEIQRPMSQFSESGTQNSQVTSDRMVNGHLVAKSFNRFINIQKSYAIILAMQIFLVIIYVNFQSTQYELDYIGSTLQSTLVLYLLNILTFPSILLTFLAQLTYNDFKSAELKEFQTTSVSQIIFNCLIILMQPYSFTDSTIIYNYSSNINDFVPFKLNYLLVITSMIKFYLLIPCVLNMNKFKNPRSSRVCKIYGCPNSNIYTIKCLFKQSPITLIAFSFIMSWLIFSFSFRVGERTKYDKDTKFDDFTNAVWLVIMTMTSVGFGDISPKTTVGRLVGFVCTFYGALTVSIMVVVVINTFEMDLNETAALKILKKLQQKKEIKKIAGNYIRISLWRVWKNYTKKSVGKFKQIEQEERNQKVLRNLLREKIRISKFTQGSNYDLGQQMSTQFQSVKFSLDNLHENTDEILNHLSNKYFINLENIKEQPKHISKGSHHAF